MSSVTLSWAADPASDNVTAYQVWGANGTSTAFGSCSKLATVSALTWTESGLPSAQARTYYIVAVNAAGSSAPEGPINITTATSTTAMIVKDEGTTLTSTPTSMNFVGAGVTATNSGNDVTVTIPGGGGGGGGSSGLVQIEKYTADGTTGTHTFSSIANSYTDLIISVVARTDDASNRAMNITVNGNSSAIYDYERLYSAGSVTPTHDNNANHTAIDNAFQMAGTGATANVATGGEITFFGYATSFFKMFSSRARHVESGTTQYQVFATGEVRTTTPISSITCALSAGNFVSGSVITLYGLTGGAGGGGATPSVVQQATFIGNSVSITMGAAPIAGNVLIAAVTHWNNGATAGTGWTQLLTNNGSAVDGWFLAWKWAAAGESATQTPVSVGTSGNNIVIWEVSGCNFVFPFQNSLETTGTTKSLTFATSLSNSLLLGMVAAIGSNIAPTITNATNTGNTTGTRSSGTPDSVTTFSAVPTANVSFTPTATYSSSVTSLMAGILLLPG